MLLRWRLVVALTLAIPVSVFAMAVRFPGWEWVSLALATPAATWAAWSFHRVFPARALTGD